MRKNMLNKVLVFGAVLCSILFYGDFAFSCGLENGWAEYEACMINACASGGKFFNGSVCVGCAKGLKASQKLQSCVKKDMTSEEEEQKYQEKQKAEEEEAERIKASCKEHQYYDDYLKRCVTDYKKLGQKNKENEDVEQSAEGAAAPSDAPGDADAGANLPTDAGDSDYGFSQGNSSGMGMGDSTAGSNGSTMTITTKTESGGEVNTDVENKDILGTSPSSEGSSSDSPEDSGENGDENEGEDEGEANTSEDNKDGSEDDDSKDDEQYDGLYEGFSIIPDEMAMHCKIKGEEVALNPELFVDCIKQYVSEMNNPNATAKAAAEREYEKLRYKLLVSAGSVAMTKAQVTGMYVKADEQHAQAMNDMKTASDDVKAMVAYLRYVTSVMNDVRELQVENLKYLVFTGIGDIDPSIVMEEEEKKKEEASSSSSSDTTAPDVNTVNVNVKIGPKE